MYAKNITTIHAIKTVPGTKSYRTGTQRKRAWHILQAYDGFEVSLFVNACRRMEITTQGRIGYPVGWVRFFIKEGEAETRTKRTSQQCTPNVIKDKD